MCASICKLRSPLDAFDGSPLLDLKPYIADLDSKADADYGWLDDLSGRDHLLQHVRGIAHAHDHGHEHEHGHDHEHDHDHPESEAPKR